MSDEGWPEFAVILATLVVVAFVLSIIGYGDAQDDEGGTTGTMAGCCAMASAYDATDDDDLNIIREFRGEYLMTNPVGRGVVALYYEVFSPSLAGFIDDHPAVKPLARAALAPVVAISTAAVDTTQAEKLVVAGLFALASVAVVVWVKKRRGRGSPHP
jgi:hypothetical protein